MPLRHCCTDALETSVWSLAARVVHLLGITASDNRFGSALEAQDMWVAVRANCRAMSVDRARANMHASLGAPAVQLEQKMQSLQADGLEVAALFFGPTDPEPDDRVFCVFTEGRMPWSC